MTGERAKIEPAVIQDAQPLWFLGTLVRVLLDGTMTGGRFAVIEVTLPKGAAPPMHSHPEDETFYVLDGEVTCGSTTARARAEPARSPSRPVRPHTAGASSPTPLACSS